MTGLPLEHYGAVIDSKAAFGQHGGFLARVGGRNALYE